VAEKLTKTVGQLIADMIMEIIITQTQRKIKSFAREIFIAWKRHCNDVRREKKAPINTKAMHRGAV